MTENLAEFILILMAIGLGLVFLLSPYGTIAFYLAFLIIIIVTIRPMYGLYIIIPIVPIRTFSMLVYNPNRTQSEKYSMGSLLIFLTYIGLSLNMWASHDSERPKANIDIVLLLFLMWSFTTLFWTQDIYHGTYVFFELLTGVIIMYIFQRTIRSVPDLVKIYKYLAFSAVIWGALMFMSKWYNGTVFRAHIFNKISIMLDIYVQEKRIGGFAPPQTASNTLAVCLFLAFSLFYSVKPFWKFVILLICLLLIDDVLLGGSKGAVGSLLLGMIFTVLASPRLRKRALTWTFSILSFFVVLYLFNMEVLSEQRLTASSKVSEASLTYRLKFWKKGFETLRLNGWIGDGIGGFAKYVDPWPGAHSFYFSILFDLGIVGFLVFMVFLLVRLFKFKKTVSLSFCNNDFLSHARYCIIGALVAFLVHGIVEMEYSFLHFWMLIGLLERVTVLSSTGANV